MLASIKMPADLFVPNAIVQTSIYVFRAKTPHNFDYDVVKFIDFRNDGYKRTERGIKDIDSPIERYHDLFLLYKLGKNAVNNSSFHNDLWNVDDVYCEGTISPDGDDWNFEKHITHKTDPIEGDFDLGIKNYLSWNIAKRIEGVEVSPYAITEPYKFDRVPAKKVFRIKSATPSYDKGELRKYCGSDDKYEYITRTAENRGICDLTGFIDKKGLQPAGTFSLGLMQMKFFYRRTPWYAGQFVKIVSCLSDKVDDFAMVYLETVLNGLSSKLLSVLVRDVEDTFLETALLLPVTKEGEVDYQWMSEFIKAKRDTLEKELLASLPNL